MSSYLSFYLVPKRKDKEKEEKQHLLLSSYSRNSDMYTAFNENLSIAFSGSDEEHKYTTLQEDDIRYVLRHLEEEINSAKERLSLYEKYASSHPDYIEDILQLKSLIKDTEETHASIQFLFDIVIDTKEGYNSFEEICCNID